MPRTHGTACRLPTQVAGSRGRFSGPLVTDTAAELQALKTDPTMRRHFEELDEHGYTIPAPCASTPVWRPPVTC